MSVVILGGNECMIRRYVDICGEYNCKAKVYPKLNGGMRNIGSPDLLILFTNTMSHKMVNSALSGANHARMKIERSHSASASALRGILDKHTN